MANTNPIPDFHEVRFPDDIAEGSSGGPAFSTDVVTVNSGYEQRAINWKEARCEYSVGHGVKTQEQLDELIAFFRCRRGKAYGFRFKDFSDFNLVDQPAKQLSATNYQVQKVYSSGNNSAYDYVRTINKIVSGTLKVYVDGVRSMDGTHDPNTGILTFYNAVGGIVTCTCEFDVPVRFDVDKMNVAISNFQIYDWNSIALIEVRI